MYRPKVFMAIAISFSIVISTAAIANYIGHQLYPAEAAEKIDF